MWINKDKDGKLARPTDVMVERAFERNKDGGGFAYREKKDGVTEIVWKKALDVDDMKHYAKELPAPFVLHFRKASIGGPLKSLTHPFVIDKYATTDLEGRTTGEVLFHNGTWKEWDTYCLGAAGTRDAEGKVNKLPYGKWSDTRAMAWLCHVYGYGFMEFLPAQKGVIFGPAVVQIFDGTDYWKKVNDVWCSNDAFMSGYHQNQQNVHQLPAPKPGCKFPGCDFQLTNDKGYCIKHPDGYEVKHRSDRTLLPTEPTGGSVVPPSPFVQLAALPIAPEDIVTVEMAEELAKGGTVSQNLLKKIRRQWEIATYPGGKGSQRAQRTLQKITQTLLMKQPSFGHVH